MSPVSGTLFIVPTPIGNLGDISARALETLANVDLIAAEDTRHSGVLLHHFGIKTKTISLHDHNEQQRTQLLLSKLAKGESIALISDAGTPLISDPGYTLVRACREHNANVVALPGPCALTTALSASGLATDKFTFLGFLPVKQKAKQEALLEAANSFTTSIFYEAPRRIVNTLTVAAEILPEQHHIVLAKELTKHFETYVNGTAIEVLKWLEEDPVRQKGEFVLMLHCVAPENESLPPAALSLMKALTAQLPPKSAAAIVSEHYKVNKKQLYQFALAEKEQLR
jgi:16S rRNA (cytidine1402-2'-O)-methyltransferase